MSDITTVLAGGQMTAADLLPGAGNGQGGGQNVALFNHNSGIFGASGNPNASAGHRVVHVQPGHDVPVVEPAGDVDLAVEDGNASRRVRGRRASACPRRRCSWPGRDVDLGRVGARQEMSPPM